MLRLSGKVLCYDGFFFFLNNSWSVLIIVGRFSKVFKLFIINLFIFFEGLLVF